MFLVYLTMMKSSRMRRAMHAVRMGEIRNACNIFVGNPEEKRPLGRPRRRGEDNIRMDPREIWWEGVDWVHLAQDRYHGNEPSGSIKGGGGGGRCYFD
jgi:hypothetical protein